MNDIGSGKRPDRQAKACRYEEGQRCKVQLMIYCLIFSLCGPVVAETGKWAGVDETVVEKFAEQAGRPAHKPFINTDQGDLLLFMFLLAGTIGGFIAGYYFRTLFPPKAKSQKEPSNV